MQVHLQENNQVQCVDLGMCGLRTLHNAYRAGVAASKWGIDILLTSLSALFQDSPARREGLSTGTIQDTFSLHFVAHQWVEKNTKVCILSKCVQFLSWPLDAGKTELCFQCCFHSSAVLETLPVRQASGLLFWSRPWKCCAEAPCEVHEGFSVVFIGRGWWFAQGGCW